MDVAAATRVSGTADRQDGALPWSSGQGPTDMDDRRVLTDLEAAVSYRVAGLGAVPGIADAADANPSAGTGVGQADAAAKSSLVASITAPAEPGLSDRRFEALIRWRGRVIDVGTETFRAIVKDLDRPAPEEEVAIYLREVGEADRPLLHEGAVFYWHIGYEDTLGGQRTRASVIRFQRRPGWTDEDLREAQSWAARMRRLVQRV